MAEAPAEPPVNADTLGARLRSARERLELSPHKAAEELLIGAYVIEALESDDYRALGAPIFVRGHLRNYARLLGLPEEEVLVAYEHANSKPAPPPLVTLRPGGASRMARQVSVGVVSLVVIAMLVALAVVWWQHRPAEQTATALVSPPAAATSKIPEAVPAAATLTPPSASLLETRAETPTPEPKLAERHRTAPPAKLNAKPAFTTPATRLAAVPQPAPAAENPPGPVIHAKFTVTQASWIEVYDAAGRRLYYDLAPAGDNFDVSGSGPLQVFLGNAPGVSIELNGAPFNATPFTRPDNTARFRLGTGNDNGGRTG